jgi:uncharacterized membrane protein YkvA (DUF1232 family)
MFRVLVLAALGAALYLWLKPPGFVRTDWWRRKAMPIAVGVLAAVYLLSPVDLIPGLSPIALVDDLIVVLGAYWWVRRRLQAPPSRESDRNEHVSSSHASQAAWDPYVVLGVRRGASRKEITQAYREQMKLYHPDRVAELGQELQRVAHERTLDIQRAYEEVTSGK